ncbi:MAG: aryl-sulfate sulfotransferase [Candidatus Omnitrophica bacterium]|nr:aryl-sulfate sulfotransferase [Candidatus Omnitrophota bacterium]
MFKSAHLLSILACVLLITSPALAEDSKLKLLMALPYLQGYVKAPERTNVTVYNRGLTEKGYSLYSSGHTGSAYLIDMKGHVLHEWVYDINKIWPDKSMTETTPFWENIYLYPNGDLLAIYHNGGMIKIDRNSKLLWSYECTSHHDIDVDSDGNIYTLTNDWIKLKDGVLVIDNAVLILSPEGKLVKKIPFLPLMHKSKNPSVEPLLKRVIGVALAGTQDIYHTNTLQVLDGKAAIKQPQVYKKGNILISFLTLSTIAIIDPELEEIIWVGGPRLWMDGQHNATLLENGNMLTFDNHFKGEKTQSRVLEFDPFKKTIVWEYKDKGFYTDTHGSEQRLANGNTLIIESNNGRAFEVTTNGKIVWEFLNPHTTGEKNDLIAAIFAMYRIDPSATSSWLK